MNDLSPQIAAPHPSSKLKLQAPHHVPIAALNSPPPARLKEHPHRSCAVTFQTIIYHLTTTTAFPHKQHTHSPQISKPNHHSTLRCSPTRTHNHTMATPSETPFQFPPHYSFPPFFTLQPNLTTRTSQLQSWSTLLQSYCRHHRIFQLSLIDALPTPLFTNSDMARSLSLRDAKALLSWMASAEDARPCTRLL